MPAVVGFQERQQRRAAPVGHFDEHHVCFGGARRRADESPKPLRQTLGESMAISLVKLTIRQGTDLVSGRLLGCCARSIPINEVRACTGTVNRFCASGLQAIAIAAGRIVVDGAQAMIAGGMESISGMAIDVPVPWSTASALSKGHQRSMPSAPIA